MIRKFKGFIDPSQFLGHLVGLRQSAHVVYNPLKVSQKNSERIVYAGCIHGGNNQTFERLEKLISNPPDYLIFTGDVTGTPEIEKVKKYFYDEKERNPQGDFGGFEYFGNWGATLPKNKRELLLAGLKYQAEMLIVTLRRLKKLGVKIYIIEGNWDNRERSGIKVLAGKDIKNVFDMPGYFRKNGFRFINKLTTLKTKTTFHIFLPFICLLNFDEITKKEIQDILNEAEIARNEGKTIILIGHAEANWRVHHLQSEATASAERLMVIRNFGKAMAIFKPDEVIYPHQHARIRDENGKLVNIDSKYLLQVSGAGVRLVDDEKEKKSKENEIIVTYVPLGFLAEETNEILQ